MILSYRYDPSYNPPMPIIPISLISVADDQSMTESINAIVDSGADGTLIPTEYLHQIHAPAVRKAFMKGISGERRSVDIYLISIQIGSVKLRGVRVIASPSSEAILGRNVLNQLVIGLNGPAETVELHIGM